MNCCVRMGASVVYVPRHGRTDAGEGQACYTRPPPRNPRRSPRFRVNRVPYHEFDMLQVLVLVAVAQAVVQYEHAMTQQCRGFHPLSQSFPEHFDLKNRI
jgi:hypothetical protein